MIEEQIFIVFQTVDVVGSEMRPKIFLLKGKRQQKLQVLHPKISFVVKSVDTRLDMQFFYLHAQIYFHER